MLNNSPHNNPPFLQVLRQAKSVFLAVGILMSFGQLVACGKKDAGSVCGRCEGGDVCMYGECRSLCTENADCQSQGMAYCGQENVCFVSLTEAEDFDAVLGADEQTTAIGDTDFPQGNDVPGDSDTSLEDLEESIAPEGEIVDESEAGDIGV